MSGQFRTLAMFLTLQLVLVNFMATVKVIENKRTKMMVIVIVFIAVVSANTSFHCDQKSQGFQVLTVILRVRNLKCWSVTT